MVEQKIMSEKIDILVPVYNVKKYLAKCLDSLVNQTYKNINIIINENGSTDGSEQIVEDFAKKYENIKVFHTPNEGNISKARNFLLSKIESKYFTFFDSDDYAAPEYIETLYNLLVENNSDMSICSIKRVAENKSVNLKKINKKLNSVLLFDKQTAIAEMISSKLYFGSVYAKLMKTEMLGEIKFDENIHYAEDLDFCFNIMQNCKNFVFTNKKLYAYVIRKNSIVTSKFKPKKLTVLDCYNRIIEKVKDDDVLTVCAKSMKGLISTELLYYVWRDKYKDKELKKLLKQNIKESIPFIRKNKRLPSIYKKLPLVWWLTKLM